MAQVLTFAVLAFLFLQLAAGQDACTNAALALTNAADRCTPTVENPTIICDGECRDLIQDIIDNCPAAVSLHIVYSS